MQVRHSSHDAYLSNLDQDFERGARNRWLRSFGNYTPDIDVNWESGVYYQEGKGAEAQVEQVLTEQEQQQGEGEEEAQPRASLATALSLIAHCYRAHLISLEDKSSLKTLLLHSSKEDLGNLLLEGLAEVLELEDAQKDLSIVASLFKELLNLKVS